MSDPLRDVAVLLEYTLEAFDRTLPGRWSEHDRDTWLPFDTGPSARFARETRARLVARSGFALPVGPGRCPAIDSAQRMTQDEREQYLKDRGIQWPDRIEPRAVGADPFGWIVAVGKEAPGE